MQVDLSHTHRVNRTCQYIVNLSVCQLVSVSLSIFFLECRPCAEKGCGITLMGWGQSIRAYLFSLLSPNYSYFCSSPSRQTLVVYQQMKLWSGYPLHCKWAEADYIQWNWIAWTVLRHISPFARSLWSYQWSEKLALADFMNTLGCHFLRKWD